MANFTKYCKPYFHLPLTKFRTDYERIVKQKDRLQDLILKFIFELKTNINQN